MENPVCRNFESRFLPLEFPIAERYNPDYRAQRSPGRVLEKVLPAMYPRLVEKLVLAALSDTPAVLIVGPRRVGKTTLVQTLKPERVYLTLDDPAIFAAANTDPVGFIRGLDYATIDEIQRVPELLLAIKTSIDRDYRPGRFLLTGSANVLLLPRVADSLVGRMEVIQMLPLAQAEISGKHSTLLDYLFRIRKALPAPDVRVGDDLTEIVLKGGFPEVQERDEQRRRQWLRSYLSTVLSRDLREIADIEKLAELPKFVQLLAHQSAQLVNYSQLGSQLNVDRKTSQRYVGLLEKLFLVQTLQPWYSNSIKRIIKTPKLHFVDSGILTSSMGVTCAKLKNDRRVFGSLLESFVFAEILKLSTGSDLFLRPYHFRDHEMHEVDVVLERDDGMIAAVEVKSSASVNTKDFAGLKILSEAAGEKFSFGVVLYDGDTVVPFGERLAAVPVSYLWS